ncbi:hypothetical protein [Streptomyces sp. NPDC050804]|uniref:hypothetical protein n=1 Tax=Streptomyces sp. NPDC050804 TaxID=3154745 RepID=UPI00343AE791
MDVAWAAVAAGVAGAMVGGAATYFGPTRAQKRALAASSAERAAVRREEALRCVAEVRSEAQAWLTYLMQVLFDGAQGRFPDLPSFDEKAACLRSAFERPLARLLAHHMDAFYGAFAREMRAVDQHVREIVMDQDTVMASAYIRQTDSFGSHFSQRAVVTARWTDDVINGRWSDENPLRGTTFDPGRR